MSRPSNPPMNVTPMSEASETKKRGRGRPANLEMPPVPQAILDGMTELEQAHFEHFRDAYTEACKKRYGKITPTAEIGIVQAALDYIHLWRMQIEQIQTGKLVSQARQHPGTSLRAWLQSAGLQEKDMMEPAKQEDEKSANRATLLSLSS
ncbi:hypothetical protein [Ktedonobacter robiniae]|uniref:Phage terminase small subunit P27 family n=1 Tax=Ktedonobacter robiniae TaxID=2778365 RepID=A0ABQ3URS4_9CHLR|nr:hypothetical protein [Ktedonobacter robiniae]GHO55498.1 hypothetical protein KSB_39730 [Ktedonobacter robiniae]